LTFHTGLIFIVYLKLFSCKLEHLPNNFVELGFKFPKRT
jgi:hypothetical protein